LHINYQKYSIVKKVITINNINKMIDLFTFSIEGKGKRRKKRRKREEKERKGVNKA
jgi:hypothetical protein